MKIIKEKVVHKGKFLSRIDTEFEDRSGKIQTWESVSRHNSGEIAVIFAITKNDDVILVKIFRVPLGGYVYELPAGLTDKKNEDPKDAAIRELAEETGHSVLSDNIELILRGPFNAGMTNDILRIYFARDAIKTKEPELEGSEDIEVVRIPLKKLVSFVETQSKKNLVDIKILSILPILEERGLV